MSDVASFRKLSVGDAPKIAAAISQLAEIGLKPLFPEREFPELARRKVEELEGISFPDPPLPRTWIGLALEGSEQVFANAIHYQDHCFDGAGEGVYAEVVASIMALAGEEWPSAGATVTATGVVRQGQYGPSSRVEITIRQQDGCAPFDLIAGKGFDWSVVRRLNERLPPEAQGLFAAFLDSNAATIVYLRPAQLRSLGKLFGHDFISEIDQEPEEPPSHSRLEVARHVPLPFGQRVALVGVLLMGGFAASRLIGTIWRGAPYAISGLAAGSLISLADAPLEFIFFVAFYIVAAAVFLWLPINSFVRRRRMLRQARRESP
ncbi:MAG: hypothetical protein K2Y71_26435 [Xanthobacteraceae bacterium]|nr:hypothetical protein [Xanthobacteraceae bacterium]